MKFFRGFALPVLLSFIFVSLSYQSFASEYRFFSILAETMRPLDSTIEFDCDDGNLKTTTNSTLHPSSAQYIAQVNLPHGSTIDSVSCYGYDNDNNDFSFMLYRYRFNGEGKDVFEPVSQEGISSVAAPATYVDLTVGPVFPLDPPGIAVVNNEDFSYGLYLNLPKPDSNDLYVVRCVVRATMENPSYFKGIEIK